MSLPSLARSSPIPLAALLLACSLPAMATPAENDQASDRLTGIVMTGTNPKARHWAGQVGASGMPPNAADVSEADARMLVNWLLVLVP